ncbi:MAG: hypothetical protein JSS63_12720 [Bacteroidetes bacterium]|nr:hypothetical protein [Bacteroidota bacterium]
MLIKWDLPFSIIEIIIKKLSEKQDKEIFSTLDFIEEWAKTDKESHDDFEKVRGRNWRALTGKAIKKYSIASGKFVQITPPHVSPARWRFIN